MKLAEALIQRADYQKRIEQLRERLTRNAKVQEGETPAEDPQELLDELDRVMGSWSSLVKRINHTNATTTFSGDLTLTDALAERDALAKKRSVLQGLVDAASIQQSRFSRSEVKFFSTIDVADLQKQLDTLAKQYRELDTSIQELNWQTDVVEE